MAAKRKQSLVTAEDLYRFEHITDARISPDGRFVITAIRRIDRKTEKKYSNLWLFPTAGGAPRQFTYGDQSDGSPRWSPDGRHIAFLSNRKDEKQPQIYLIPLDGGEARPLTTLKGQIASFDWSPDGKQFVCVLRQPEAEELAREKDEQKKKLGIAARHYATRTFFKLDGAGYQPETERWHIWTINAHTGKATQLTSGAVHDQADPAWSPDGQWIAYVANQSDDPDLQPDRVDLYVMSADGRTTRRLPTPIGPKAAPSWSPDGRWIAYIGVEGEGLWWKNSSLWVIPSDADDAAVTAVADDARNLTAAADLHVAHVTSSDTGTGQMMPPTWSADGQTLYFQASRHGDTALMAVSWRGDAVTIDRVLDTPGTVECFTGSATMTQIAYVLSTLTDPGQLYLFNTNTRQQRKLSNLNEKWLHRLELGKIEEVWFAARDGYQLHGWILFPPGFDPSQTYPSILQIHGGPHVQYGRSFMHEFFYLAAQGYVVYFSNPRGGQGYGDAHTQAIANAWGTVDYDDVLDWANYMRQQPYIDPQRMGVTGGSYGGYMTNLIIGRSKLFKAAVTQRSLSNLISMWGSSDFNWAFQQTYGDDKPPFANIDAYWDGSPLKYIGACTTPTLVIHSQMDQRVAQEQGEQVYVALKTLGIDTELVLFPDEPHGLSRNGRTDRRIARLNHILRWFDKYLK
ncbi:MAG: S9 family peptidase [Anaerolinea sp.]|nr:S9 family peptidase [Anaerolinea sp.]